MSVALQVLAHKAESIYHAVLVQPGPWDSCLLVQLLPHPHCVILCIHRGWFHTAPSSASHWNTARAASSKQGVCCSLSEALGGAAVPGTERSFFMWCHDSGVDGKNPLFTNSKSSRKFLKFLWLWWSHLFTCPWLLITTEGKWTAKSRLWKLASAWHVPCWAEANSFSMCLLLFQAEIGLLVFSFICPVIRQAGSNLSSSNREIKGEKIKCFV